jgi:hypothetical protein
MESLIIIVRVGSIFFGIAGLRGNRESSVPSAIEYHNQLYIKPCSARAHTLNPFFMGLFLSFVVCLERPLNAHIALSMQI